MLNVGVFFGGASREREVSFAGGRTVYDNLDKNLFRAIPIFVDTYGNLVQLNWEFVYRGTIRDFFPPAAFLPPSEHGFQVYSESLSLPEGEYRKMLSEIGEVLTVEQLKDRIDFAFLALHGAFGEDGSIQGLLQWLGIPFSGSGILPSALGVPKRFQKQWWDSSLPLSSWSSMTLTQWNSEDRAERLQSMKSHLGLPFVVKSSNQGSSIGVQIIHNDNLAEFEEKVNATFFIRYIDRSSWETMDHVQFIQELIDLRGGLGLPVLCNDTLIRDPEVLLAHISDQLSQHETIKLQSTHGEYEVVFEQFLKGREFSCIVIVDDDGKPLALPPTEVVKGQEIFDYNSKYLPGLSHKQTPIQIEADKINEIRSKCVQLFKHFGFEVYARIDGFLTDDGIYLNDPNTTSGMMPSSFFFHQAAEIGLNPKNFITYIVRSSLAERLRKDPASVVLRDKLSALDHALQGKDASEHPKTKVAIFLGGYSTERHISVESGRNIYEKLASSVNYEPVPVFVSGKDHAHELYRIPIQILLKDNADDIRFKVEHPKRSEILDVIREEAHDITQKYTQGHYSFDVEKLSYDQIAEEFDAVFIALHGRPGEDGQVQAELDKRGVPYNGSGVKSSQQTINKYETNQLLRAHGFLVADSLLVRKEEWLSDKTQLVNQIERLTYPMICKPHDEGCSSAVIKINNRAQLEAYAALCFALTERNQSLEEQLGIGPKDEFPQKELFMAETFTSKGDAEHFIEITGGMLTSWKDGKLEYEVFEPSEALSSGTVLSLAEKFLAGEGQNITPARFSTDADRQAEISAAVRQVLGDVAKTMGIQGYCRIDAFVRIYKDRPVEVVIIEINSLPGMTPATCIYHQAAINSYKPYQFIDRILNFGIHRNLEHTA